MNNINTLFVEKCLPWYLSESKRRKERTPLQFRLSVQRTLDVLLRLTEIPYWQHHPSITRRALCIRSRDARLFYQKSVSIQIFLYRRIWGYNRHREFWISIETNTNVLFFDGFQFLLVFIFWNLHTGFHTFINSSNLRADLKAHDPAERHLFQSNSSYIVSWAWPGQSSTRGILLWSSQSAEGELLRKLPCYVASTTSSINNLECQWKVNIHEFRL